MSETIRRWGPLAVAQVNWKRWGLGVEVSLGNWWPHEFSVYVQIGPILLGGGIEENFDWRYGEVTRGR